MMSYDNRQRRGGYGSESLPTLDTHKIDLTNVDADLFSAVAQDTAKTLAENTKSNKPTQLRRFYDEIVMWDNRASMHPDKFEEYLPFIRMLNAKAAYALGRKLVDNNYVTLLSHSLKQVNDDKTMRNFKLFMEAMMGFYKQERPSG